MLPAFVAIDLDDLVTSLLDEPNLDQHELFLSWPSRLFIDKDWMDRDHYFDIASGRLAPSRHVAAVEYHLAPVDARVVREGTDNAARDNRSDAASC